jgi:small subunit ribosomal protein S9
VTDFEHPEDDERGADEESAGSEEPAAQADTPAQEPQPTAEELAPEAEEPQPTPAAEEPEPPPAAEEPQPTPAAQEPEPAPAAEEPEPAPVAQEPEPTPAAEEPTPAAQEPPPAPPAPATTDGPEVEIVAVEDPTGEELIEVEEESEELTPRQKPEIPGADLEPDIIPEGEEFLDAEALAAAEAEAEAAAARAQEAEDEAKPIADAAIDLAAGARYTATGKRKTAVARVTLKPGTGTYTINSKSLEDFFPRETLQRIIRQPLETVGYESRMDVIARMHGGGVAAQAGALRHGISRALIVADPHLRGELKRRGFLTRDPRVKERKKAGLKKARKRPQFSKR